MGADTAQLIFSGIVTLATVVYAVLTYQLVAETKRMRRAQTDANVTLALEARQEYLNWIDLRLRNEGLGPATEVSFDVEVLGTDCNLKLVERVQSLGYVKYGLDYFAPGQEMRTFLLSLTDDYESLMASKLRVTIRFRNPSGEMSVNVFKLDFAAFEGMHQLGTPDLHEIAKSLKSISKDIGHITSGFSQPRVITQSVDDYRREREERFGGPREPSGSPEGAEEA